MSGRKLVLYPYNAIPTQPNNALYTQAPPTNIQFLDNISIQANVTGTPTGNLLIQGSLDYKGKPAPATGNFITAQTVAITSSGNSLVNYDGLSFPWLRLVWSPTGAGAQTVAPIADTGVRKAQTVSTVPDVAGSLNSTYFLLSSINTTTKAQKNFYLWLDINGAGVDPAIAGRTGIHVTGATGVTANALATSIRTALNALTGDFVATGATNAVIITDVAPGPVTAAVDGAAPTGFTFGTATAGVASNLNNKYFLLTSGNNVHSYYVWMNVDGIGTDPAPAGLTGIEIDFAAGATAGTVGTAIASAVAAIGATLVFSTSGTTTVTITNLVTGPFAPAADSVPAPTGFTFAITAGSGTINAYIAGKQV